jgi:hypothetical protein
MPFFACFEAKNGVYICGKHIFLLGKHETLQEASKTHFIVRIGFEKPYERARYWV